MFPLVQNIQLKVHVDPLPLGHTSNAYRPVIGQQPSSPAAASHSLEHPDHYFIPLPVATDSVSCVFLLLLTCLYLHYLRYLQWVKNGEPQNYIIVLRVTPGTPSPLVSAAPIFQKKRKVRTRTRNHVDGRERARDA